MRSNWKSDIIVVNKIDLLDESRLQSLKSLIKNKFGQKKLVYQSSLTKEGVQQWMAAQYAINSLKNTRGAIVNICSKVAETGQGNTSGHAASNGVRLGLTSTRARELVDFGIRSKAVVVSECSTPQYEW